MKFTKKADVDPLKVMGSMLVIGIVIVVVVIIFRDKVESSFRSIGPIEVSSKNKLCEVRGKQLAEQGTIKETIEGDKGDGFPDDCDNCLGGDNRKISNSYGIADECYVQPTKDNKIKTYKDMCKAKGGCYISDTDQCCRGEARSRCGQECK